MRNKASERVGETGINNTGKSMRIVAYKSAFNIGVQFKDGTIVKASYISFSRGAIKNPYDVSLYGRGYMGVGSYKTRERNKKTKCYKTWSGMLERCYSPRYQKKRPSYIGCTVCEEWFNFQSFAEWYEKNYYSISGHAMHIDKDILVKGNKVYGPETCIFVPEFINTLFLKCNAARGKYPVGVVYDKRTGRFEASCQNGGSCVYLGRADTAEEAFLLYKHFKEDVIKSIANQYRGLIPEKLYGAMMTYSVEADD